MNRPSAPLENHAAPESLSPDWLAEIMTEIARRFDLTTADGLNRAEEAAMRFSDDFGLKCRACAALARGYHHRRLSLIFRTLDPEADANALENEHASRSLREAVELANRAEGVAA